MTGLICETYPDPAIRKLGLWPMDAGARDSYKGDARALRQNIMRHLTQGAPWLRLSPTHRHACIESDDCLDALVCALVARAVQRHLTTQPPPDVAKQAMTEGWIHLPADDFDLPNLLDRP